MAYTSTVTAGVDDILASQYNNLRKDALGIIEPNAAAGGIDDLDWIYLNASGEAAKANADAAATAKVRGVSIAGSTISAGNACTIQTRGLVTIGGSHTPNDEAYLDTTDGAIVDSASAPSITSGAQIVKVGWWYTATILMIQIEHLTP